MQVYFYAESKTTHTTHADGLEIFNFPKQVILVYLHVHIENNV